MPTINGIGGGGNHALLINLDYPTSGHTNFAGTGVPNEFTRQMIVAASPLDADLGETEWIVNNEFDIDLSGWDGVDETWAWDRGAATHTPGAWGTISQAIDPIDNQLYVIRITVSGMTDGRAVVYDDGQLTARAETNGTFYDIAYIYGNENIYIDASPEFDGRIESVSLRQVAGNILPGAIAVKDFSNSIIGEIGGDPDENLFLSSPIGIAISTTTGTLRVHAATTVFVGLPTDSTGLPTGALWNDSGTLKIA